MEWADDLRKFRDSIETIRQQASESREIGEAEMEERLTLIQEAFEELQPESYLEQMNRILLEGRGELEVYLPWDEEEDEDEEDEEDEMEWDGDDVDDDEDEDDEYEGDEDEFEGADVASAILVWDDGECELAIDIGLENYRIYWQVNGEDVPTNDRALREALKKAFADEIGL